jgi:hypothetical protein
VDTAVVLLQRQITQVYHKKDKSPYLERDMEKIVVIEEEKARGCYLLKVMNTVNASSPYPM